MTAESGIAELALVCGVFGLCVGSFANVVVARVPRSISVAKPASRCPTCGNELAWFDNVPLLSWFALKGRCRMCAAPISARYPIVEAVTAGLWAAAALRFGAHVETLTYLILFAALVMLSAIDLDVHRLPIAVVRPAMAACGAALLASSAVDNRWDDLVRAAIGAGVGFGFLFLIRTVKPKAMGYGDVRRALLLGVMLGYQGLGYVALGLFAGFAFGAVGGVALIVAKRGSFGRKMAFGPYLAAGTIVALLGGRSIVDWYAGLLRLPDSYFAAVAGRVSTTIQCVMRPLASVSGPHDASNVSGTPARPTAATPGAISRPKTSTADRPSRRWAGMPDHFSNEAFAYAIG
ncbi:MAG: A24 family peptidase [Acidimicrobiia bacterium]